MTIDVSPEHTRLGWVGLGVMGASMAANLLDAGYSMTVYTRTRSSADAVLAKGATWADHPAAVADTILQEQGAAVFGLGHLVDRQQGA